MIAVRDHMIFVDGKRVPFRRTPNIGGALNPEGIILHDTAGGLAAEGSISWLCNPAAKASAHVVLARDGAITQLAPLNVRTWHAGASNWKGRPNVNAFAIGIEIVNPGKLEKAGAAFVNSLKVKITPGAKLVVREASSPAHGRAHWLDYTNEQVEAVVGLCAAIRDAYAITFIGTHWEISPGRKINTSPLFPLESVRARVFGRLGEATADGDNSGTVMIAGLNVRSGAGTSFDKIGSLGRGAVVSVRSADRNGDDIWLLVDYDNGAKTGWVAGRYVDLSP